MKKKSAYIIGLSIIILIFGIFTIKNFIYRDAHGKLVDPDDVSGLKKMPGKEKKENTAKKRVGYILLNGKKKKAPSFRLIDQNGDTISNNDYKGKVYVVEFFYTTCPTICPVMNENLKEVSKAFKGNKKFGIASFSIDPEHDTQKVLKEYAEKHDITNPNWHLLTGARDSIYDLAQKGFLLNAEEDPNEPGGILHSGMFALIDQDGFLRSRKDDYGNPIIYYRGFIKRGAAPEVGQEKPQIDALIKDIKDLLHE